MASIKENIAMLSLKGHSVRNSCTVYSVQSGLF